jgi:serine/threonine protein kinase
VTYEDGLDVIQGILIEFVASISLRSFIGHNPPFPHELITQVCEDAISLIHQLSDACVLNGDVRLDNMLVRTSDHRCVLIDLTHCRNRRDDESEADWIEAKRSQDEEGAIGYVVEGAIKEAFGSKVWVYKPSWRFYPPLPLVSSHSCQQSSSKSYHSNTWCHRLQMPVDSVYKCG